MVVCGSRTTTRGGGYLVEESWQCLTSCRGSWRFCCCTWWWFPNWNYCRGKFPLTSQQTLFGTLGEQPPCLAIPEILDHSNGQVLISSFRLRGIQRKDRMPNLCCFDKTNCCVCCWTIHHFGFKELYSREYAPGITNGTACRFVAIVGNHYHRLCWRFLLLLLRSIISLPKFGRHVKVYKRVVWINSRPRGSTIRCSQLHERLIHVSWIGSVAGLYDLIRQLPSVLVFQSWCFNMICNPRQPTQYTTYISVHNGDALTKRNGCDGCCRVRSDTTDLQESVYCRRKLPVQFIYHVLGALMQQSSSPIET